MEVICLDYNKKMHGIPFWKPFILNEVPFVLISDKRDGRNGSVMPVKKLLIKYKPMLWAYILFSEQCFVS